VVPPDSRGIPRVPRYSGTRATTLGGVSSTGLSPCLVGRSNPLRLHSQPSRVTPALALQPQGACSLVWANVPVRSPLLRESRLISFPRVTEMFQFTRLASPGLCIQLGDDRYEPAGFPHSGTTGSQPACGSPMLFAAYRALRRLSVPRHPPCALIRLTGLCFDAPRR
jgi:hypothetical protein